MRGIVGRSYGDSRGSRSAQVRNRWMHANVERLVAREDESVDGGAPQAVPSGLGATLAQADDALPPRLFESRPAVLARPGGRSRRQNRELVAVSRFSP